MNSRRLIAAPEARARRSYRQRLVHRKGSSMSALGKKSDICAAAARVRFTPESAHLQCTSRVSLLGKSGHDYSKTSEDRADWRPRNRIEEGGSVPGLRPPED